MKMILITAAVFVLLFSTGSFTRGTVFRTGGKEPDPADYLLQLTGADLRDQTESGTIIVGKIDGEEISAAELRLSLTDSDENKELLDNLLTQTGSIHPSNKSYFPSSSELKGADDIIFSLQEKKVFAKYYAFLSGNRAKTRSLYFFAAVNEEGKIFLYFFG